MTIKIYDDMTSCTEWQSGILRGNLTSHEAAKVVLNEALNIMKDWDSDRIDEYLVSMLETFGNYESEDWSCEQCGHIPESYTWEIEGEPKATEGEPKATEGDRPRPSEQNPPQEAY